MTTWAVIRTGGKQYKVEEGQNIDIEKIEGKADVQVIFDEVLIVKNDKGLILGKPRVEKAKVKGKILKTFRDKKIRVVKFKSKILIEKIESA